MKSAKVRNRSSVRHFRQFEIKILQRFLDSMDNIRCVQVPPVLRKEKKKQVKDELDRIKQAEKKKRRLEKALATSAAIRSELEKKKQKKKEEQQRLDEEGAAIAEAVALHVLCDDSDDSCQIVLNNDQSIDFNKWDHAGNIGLVMGGLRAGPAYQGFTKYSIEGVGWISDVHDSACKWSDCGMGLSLQAPYFEESGIGGDVPAGLIAAQAVSSLQIAEDLRNKINLYKEV